MSRRERKRKENRQVGLWMFAIFGVIALLCFGGFAYINPTHTEYQYNVKAEQVYDNDRIEEAVAMQNLSEDERTILYESFKKSDHFMGGAEVTVERRQKLDTFDGWKVIETQGVYLLVAINGPTEYTRLNGFWPSAVVFVGWFSALIAAMGLKEVLFPSA